MPYCLAITPRAGLGNKLFPWARSRVHARALGLPALATQWAQVKLGQLLRRESDLRLYTDLFRPLPGELSGPSRWWRLLRAARVEEPEALSLPTAAGPEDLVVFSGWRDYFTRLNGHEDALRADLQAITRPRWLEIDPRIGQEWPIGINVRRGDFRDATSPEEFYTTGGLRTPIGWFVQTLEWLRRRSGRPLPAFVISDGTPAELSELLALPGVVRIDPGSAIRGIWMLSRARVLLASGGSTFSAWASFLGRMPTLAIPGQNLGWYGFAGETAASNSVWSPEHPAAPDYEERLQRHLRP